MTLIVSLISGLAGVVLGAIIQIIYSNKIETQRTINDYKKICMSEWILLNKELHTLLERPQGYNNTIFRQSIIQKTLILDFMCTSCCKKQKGSIDSIREYIKKTDEELSLGDFAEEALNKGENHDNKLKLSRDVSTLINFVLEGLSKL